MNVGVAICTYGDAEWGKRAVRDAFPSVVGQVPSPVVSLHHEPDRTLAESRNRAAEKFPQPRDGWPYVDWLCFLDADDQLADGYITAMWDAARRIDPDVDRPGHPLPNVLLIPSVQYAIDGVCQGDPTIPARGRSVYELNAAVIGTMLPRRLFDQVGGFREFDLYEDWDLWLRCLRAGARPVLVPDAVYCADGTPGRNTAERDITERVYWQIRGEHEPHLRGQRWPR